MANRTRFLLTAKLLLDGGCRGLLPAVRGEQEETEPHGDEESEELDDKDRASAAIELPQRRGFDFRDSRCDGFAALIGGEQ